ERGQAGDRDARRHAGRDHRRGARRRVRRRTDMMPAGSLARMVVSNTLRSRRHFILSAFGIVIGIATFVLFLASTEQVGLVLEKIFPVEEVEVVAPQVSLLGKDISKRLDDSLVEIIKTRSEAKRVLPRM